MAARRKAKKPTGPVPVESVRHEETRTTIPTAELADLVPDDADRQGLRYPRDPSLDPQLVWKGKDDEDGRDLVVNPVPIYVQEKVVPQALVENLRRTAKGSEPEPEATLFDDFDGLDELEMVEFYEHDKGRWANRMILGDSLAVMASLAEREDLRGKVQMIYVDPRVLLAKANPDLAMGDDLLKKTGAGNLFMIFGEPDVAITRPDIGADDPSGLAPGPAVQVEVKGLDVYDPTRGEVRTASTDDLAAWFIDTDYDGRSFFVRHAYFTGGQKPYESLAKALKADIDADAWASLYSTTSRPFPAPSTGKIAVKVINHYGDEVLQVYEVT